MAGNVLGRNTRSWTVIVVSFVVGALPDRWSIDGIHKFVEANPIPATEICGHRIVHFVAVISVDVSPSGHVCVYDELTMASVKAEPL